MKTHPLHDHHVPPPQKHATHHEPVGSTPNSCGPEQPPPQWAWHYRTLQKLRDRLVRAHAQHFTETIAPSEMSGIDAADAAEERLDRDTLLARLNSEGDQLFEVDSALQRIRDGVYGFCEETGHPIPEARLRAIPWTRYALATAQAVEQQPASAKRTRHEY